MAVDETVVVAVVDTVLDMVTDSVDVAVLDTEVVALALKLDVADDVWVVMLQLINVPSAYSAIMSFMMLAVSWHDWLSPSICRSPYAEQDSWMGVRAPLYSFKACDSRAAPPPAHDSRSFAVRTTILPLGVVTSEQARTSLPSRWPAHSSKRLSSTLTWPSHQRVDSTSMKLSLPTFVHFTRPKFNEVAVVVTDLVTDDVCDVVALLVTVVVEDSVAVDVAVVLGDVMSHLTNLFSTHSFRARFRTLTVLWHVLDARKSWAQPTSTCDRLSHFVYSRTMLWTALDTLAHFAANSALA